jgi:hypothetical protein
VTAAPAPSRHIRRTRPSRSRSPAHDRRAGRPSGRPSRRISRSARPPGFPARVEQRRGIGHRVVEPEPVEIVAQIVVIGDVLLRLPLGIRLQPEAQPLVGAHQPHARKAVIDLLVVRMDEVHEGLQVRRRPPFVEIGLAEAQVALADQPREDVGVVDVSSATGPGFGPSARNTRPSGSMMSSRPCSMPFAWSNTACEIARQPGFTRWSIGRLRRSCCHRPSLFLATVWPLDAPGDTSASMSAHPSQNPRFS